MSLSHPFLSLSPDERMSRTLSRIREAGEVWILKDEDGCVMLTTDDEDGVPVWPDKGLATLWATDEWEDCEPMSISLKDWLSKWVPGMIQDGLMVMICPVPAEEGEVIEPQEMAEALLR